MFVIIKELFHEKLDVILYVCDCCLNVLIIKTFVCKWNTTMLFYIIYN